MFNGRLRGLSDAFDLKSSPVCCQKYLSNNVRMKAVPSERDFQPNNGNLPSLLDLDITESVFFTLRKKNQLFLFSFNYFNFNLKALCFKYICSNHITPPNHQFPQAACSTYRLSKYSFTSGTRDLSTHDF